MALFRRNTSKDAGSATGGAELGGGANEALGATPKAASPVSAEVNQGTIIKQVIGNKDTDVHDVLTQTATGQRIESPEEKVDREDREKKAAMVSSITGGQLLENNIVSGNPTSSGNEAKNNQPGKLRTIIGNRMSSPLQAGPSYTVTAEEQATSDNTPPGPLDTRTVPRQPSLAESGINKVRGLFGQRGKDQATATDTPPAPSGETAEVNPVASPSNTPVEGGLPVQGPRIPRRLGQFGNPAAETTTPPPEAAPNNGTTVPTETPAPEDATSTEGTGAVKETPTPTTTPDAGTAPVTEAPPVVAAEDGATAEPSTSDNEAGNATTSDARPQTGPRRLSDKPRVVQPPTRPGTNPSPATAQPQLVEDLDQGISLDPNMVSATPTGGPTPAPEAAPVVTPADSESGTVTAAKVALGEISEANKTKRQAGGTADQEPQPPHDTTPLVDRGTPEARQAHAEQVARNDVTPTLQDRVRAGEITQMQANALLAENRANYGLNAQRLVTLQNSSDEDVLSRGENDPKLGRPVRTLEEARQLRQREIDDLRNKTRPEFRPSASPEAKATQPVESADKQAAREKLDVEIAALMEVSKQQPLTPQQLDRLTVALGERKALGQSPEARRQAVIDELRRTGQPPTEEQQAILLGEEIPDAPRTKEELAAENKRQREALKQQADEMWARGENPIETILEYNRLLAESQGMKPDPNEENATRELLNQMFSGEAVSSNEGRFAKKIREKFVKLGQLEMQIIKMKSIKESMKNNRKGLETAMNAAKSDYENEKDDMARINKLAIYEQKSEGLKQYEDAMRGEAERERHLKIQRVQVSDYIHRKLGTRSWVKNLGYGAYVASLQLQDAVADLYEWGLTERFA